MGASVVQSAKGFINAAFSAVTATFPSAVTAGNVILAILFNGGGTISGSPSDNQSNTYSSPLVLGTTWATDIGAWYAKGVAAGSTTVQFGTSTLNNFQLHVFEIAGADATTPVLNSQYSENHPNVSFAPSVTISLSQGAIVVAVGGTSNGSGSGGTASAGGAATQLTAIQQSDQSNCVSIGESLACPSGSNTLSVSGSGIGTVTDWVMFAVAFKDASASGPSAALQRRRRWTNPMIPVIN